MTEDLRGRHAQLRELELAMDEAANTPPKRRDGDPIARFGDVIEAFGRTALEVRLAYWGYPHPGSVGDAPLVVRVEGRDLAVAGVRFDNGRILVDTAPIVGDHSGV